MPFGDDDNENNQGEGGFNLIGTLLIDKVVKFNFLKETMATIWRPVKRMMPKEIATNLFIFQFFHEKDIRRVIEEGPWSFDQHLLNLHHQ